MTDSVTLNDGNKLPLVGLGTYLINDGEECKQSVRKALEVGYRLIDTASVYRNEQFIGEVLSDEEFMKSVGVKRQDLFITTKVGPSDQGKGKCRQSVLASLEKLKLEQVDLVLIHWPGTTGLPTDSPQHAVLRKESWEDLEELVREKKVRSIGVSNYCIKHLEELLGHCSIRPVVNQVEFHPLLYLPELLAYCNSVGIVLQAYSSLGSAKGWETLSANPTIIEIAKERNKSIAQVLLRWALSHDVPVIPKSSKENRLRDNFELSFELSADEVSRIDKLNENKRFCWDPTTIA